MSKPNHGGLWQNLSDVVAEVNGSLQGFAQSVNATMYIATKYGSSWTNTIQVYSTDMPKLTAPEIWTCELWGGESDGRTISLSNPDRAMKPKDKITIPVVANSLFDLDYYEIHADIYRLMSFNPVAGIAQYMSEA